MKGAPAPGVYTRDLQRVRRLHAGLPSAVTRAPRVVRAPFWVGVLVGMVLSGALLAVGWGLLALAGATIGR